MSRLAAWSLVVLLFAAFVGAAAYTLRAGFVRGRGMPAYSVYAETRDGLSEAAHVVRELGWSPVAVTRPIQHTNHRGLLIVTEPAGGVLTEHGGLGEGDAQALLHWVEAGNTLLLACRRTTELHRALEAFVIEQAAEDDDLFTPLDLGNDGGATPYTEGMKRLSVRERGAVQTRDGLPLWDVRKGEPGAAVVGRGKGRVILLAAPSLLTREGLVLGNDWRDDNVLFLANVCALHARDGTVYFDEFHHGLRSGGGFWGYLGYHGRRLVLLPFLVVVGVAVWNRAVRLGPAVPAPRPPSDDAVEYATALARIYQRAGARRLLGRTLARGFLAALTRHLRLRRNALPAEVLAAWRQQDAGPSMERLKNLLRGVGELRKGDVSERQLLNWARAFDSFEREMIRSVRRLGFAQQ
jgi:hypothetical protein